MTTPHPEVPAPPPAHRGGVLMIAARRTPMPSLPETRIARPMQLAETDIIIDYFHSASPEFLNTLGVDPSLLLERAQWKARFAQLFALPIERRNFFAIIWEIEGQPAGWSSADKIV